MANTTSNQAGLFKQVYGKLKNVVPTNTPFINQVKFSKRKRLGSAYVEGVRLQLENGVTFGAAGSDVTALNDAVDANLPQASGSGSEIWVRSLTTEKALSSAMEAGESAFKSQAKNLILNQKESMGNFLEVASVNGNRPIGIIQTFTDTGTGTATLLLTTASWIPLAFLGRTNIKVDVYSTGGTKRNTANDITVTAIDPTLSAPTLTISGDNTEVDSIQNGDYVYYKGAKDTLAKGICEIASLTSGDTYLNLAVNTYGDLWRGNSYGVSGAMSFAKLNTGLMYAAMRGGKGDHMVMVPPTAWEDLSSEFNALRTQDSSYNKENGSYGTKGIEFQSYTGRCKLVPSLAVRRGEAVAFPMRAVERRGSKDQEFRQNGEGGSPLQGVPGTATREVICGSDQLVWTTDPNSCVLFTGITS